MYSPDRIVDSYGSLGQPFERCRNLASHNVFENRAVVKNLVNAGLVSGDAPFLQSLESSDEEYAEILEQIYGMRKA